MSLIEQKINAIAQILLSQDEGSREQAREKLAQLMDAAEEPQEPVGAEHLIHQILAEIGVPTGRSGHSYLVEAISAAVKDPLVLDGVTKPGGLYQVLGAKCGKSPKSVDHSVRNCIEAAWIKGDAEAQAKYFGTAVSSKTLFPTNVNFISRMANIVRFQMKRQ